MSSDKARKDKNQNIQVFVRVRPFNQKERDNSGVVEVAHNREVTVRLSQQSSLTKKFTFDRAFGPNTSQLQVYQEVVSPLIEEVLAGYNCTVFAYGQTGTGKTHTMVGESSGSETNWQNDPLAGIIPRALSQLFDELRLSNTEHTVRVSYLELYNEELVDLLSSSEDNSKLRIYEDITRKGSNIVNGLEEFTVHNKNEVYKIMAQGQERKKVASTLINSQSSRSHTVFTIVVHMKENSAEGEELVKIGKLNLVDLAGSENISKAGSDNPAKKERARECVNINQSLLTLGRVITALVERHPHIPYRESKLTRILQESLGGRTKTSIIATISPGNKDLEETLNTLEYAHRAKNIQNKPEINQKLTKKAILKEYAEEIDRLKRDLQAARDKSGVYLANETYEQMTLKQEVQNKEIQELLLKKRAMEDERQRMEGVFSELNRALQASSQKLTATKTQLEDTKAELASTSTMLVQTKQECVEQEYLVTKHVQTESALSAQAKELLATADVATTHVACLHDTVDKRKGVEYTNLEVTGAYREQAARCRDSVSASVHDFASSMALSLCCLHEALDAYTTTTTRMHQNNKEQLENLAKIFVDAVVEIKCASSESHDSLVQAIVSNGAALRSSVEGHRSAVQTALGAFLQSLVAFLQRVKEVDVEGNVATFVHNWYLGASERVTSLQRAHATHSGHTRSMTEKSYANIQKICDNRRAHIARQADEMRALLVEMENYSRRTEEEISQQLIDIETERRETELRIEQWMDEERRALEERLARYAASEKKSLERRLAKKLMEVDNLKKILEENMARCKELQQIQLDAANEEMKLIEEDLAESQSLRDEYANYVKKYEKEFGEGTNAISVDMEVFSKNVVEVVEHINNEMLRQLEQTREGVEQGVSGVIATDAEICKQFIQEMERALTIVITTTQQLIERLISSIEAETTKSVETLSALGSSTSELMFLSAGQLVSHGEVCDAARAQAASLETRVGEELGQLAELEGRYLQQEYRVYSPTGKTPSRTEWRYPRQLASTSPHDRILARFRAMRHTSLEDVSNTETTRASDLESSVSDDSALFAAPFARSASASAIVKCTSETDIPAIGKLQDSTKENVSRSSSSLNKPSKLRVPSAPKYPLGERNDV